MKEGLPQVQPPVELLEQMLTVRLHLDDADADNGSLRVIPGTHRLGRLNAESDLDLTLIYDAAGVEMSDGAKPLATRAYYARLMQAVVTALSAQTAEGRLYEVDVRLRPSGRAGAVATSLEGWRG